MWHFGLNLDFTVGRDFILCLSCSVATLPYKFHRHKYSHYFYIKLKNCNFMFKNILLKFY